MQPNIGRGVFRVESYIQAMKHSAQRWVCAAGFFLLSVTTRAATADAGNPYADTIVGRNVFSLKTPPPPPNPEDLIKKEPPPKILLQGLTTILGRRQVLFKVQATAKPGQPAKEESYVLTEGERQGEIEVLEIDENAGVVKFNNHGTVEPLNMKDHVAKAPAGAPPPTVLPQPGRPTLPGIPAPTAANPASTGPSVVNTFGGSREIPSRALRTTPTVGGAPAAFGGAQNPQAGPALSREEAEILVEAKQMYYQQQNDDRHRIMPRTSLSTPSQQPSPQPQPE